MKLIIGLGEMVTVVPKEMFQSEKSIKRREELEEHLCKFVKTLPTLQSFRNKTTRGGASLDPDYICLGKMIEFEINITDLAAVFSELERVRKKVPQPQLLQLVQAETKLL